LCGAEWVNAIVLDNIPFHVEMHVLTRQLRIKAGSSYVDDLKRMVDEALAIAKPKALCKVAFVEAKGDDYVVVEGIRLTSRVLRVNLENAYRVFPYLATCGVELADWCTSQGDLLRQFWAEAIAEMALGLALSALREHLADRYRPGDLSAMAPGSLADWPLEEQPALFSLLGNTEGLTGVRLNDHLLMLPAKSVSGIFFNTETHFESCQLCARAKCPGRRAPYDEGLYDRRYRPTGPAEG
jgi:hypothetical protein